MADSPIEMAMLSALLEPPDGIIVYDETSREAWLSDDINPQIAASPRDEDGSAFDLAVGDGVGKWIEASLYRDVKALSYRLDFGLNVWSSRRGRWHLRRVIAVECDGHDYHEKTKQQAAYDKARDRELQAAGVVVLRFTGSEIHHSVERCAADVFEVVRRVFARIENISFVVDSVSPAQMVAPEEHW